MEDKSKIFNKAENGQQISDNQDDQDQSNVATSKDGTRAEYQLTSTLSEPSYTEGDKEKSEMTAKMASLLAKKEHLKEEKEKKVEEKKRLEALKREQEAKQKKLDKESENEILEKEKALDDEIKGVYKLQTHMYVQILVAFLQTDRILLKGKLKRI